jgi:hypothetical protein
VATPAEIQVLIELHIKDKQGGDLLDVCKNLVREYAFRHEHPIVPVQKVVLSPVPRLGMSGSYVFYMDVHNKKTSKVKKLVAKFSGKRKIREEQKNATNFTDVEKPFEDSKSGYGLMVYKNVVNATEFRNYFLDRGHTDNDCCETVRKLYTNTVARYIPTQEKNHKTVSVIANYERYLERRSTKPLDKLKSMSSFFNRGLGEIRNPYDFYVNDLRPKWGSRQILPRLVHGDLHARNIMVPNSGDSPELIDYAWGHYGHRAVDFVLLESTIKYMLLSEYCFKYAKEYVPVDIFVDFEKQLCAQGLSLSKYNPPDNHGLSEAIKALQRCFVCIKAIRDCAKTYLDCASPEKIENGFSSKEEEYFLSLFLVSLGLIAFPTVDEGFVVAGCGLLVPCIAEYAS